uniref:Uncharacterized protein n=1 Tax=Steinernema glaseri TaxID=37863 RepID=A0A1I7ZK47_9BILA
MTASYGEKDHQDEDSEITKAEEGIHDMKSAHRRCFCFRRSNPRALPRGCSSQNPAVLNGTISEHMLQMSRDN